jgi:hypothetical protein
MIEQRDKKGRIIRATGRSTGSKNKRPNIHALLPPDAVQQLYTALFQLALAGDTAASRLLLDRLDPAPKGRPVELPEVPPIDGIESAQQAGRRVLETMLAGERPAAEVHDLVVALAVLADMVETTGPLNNGGSSAAP